MIQGTLHRNDRGRWEIVGGMTWPVELTCGDVIRALVCGQWIPTRIEHDGTDYVSFTPTVFLHEGLQVRQ